MIYEVCAAWEGDFFAHEALTLEEAKEWAKQYEGNKDCKIRIWQVIR